MFRATRLDRNQILRLVLFLAAHSNEFNDILKQYKRKDVPIPKALWELNDQDLWLDNSPITTGKERYVNETKEQGTLKNDADGRVDARRESTLQKTSQKVKRRNGEVHTGTGYDIQRTDRGGIIIKFD
jgi:hypothetical protein